MSSYNNIGVGIIIYDGLLTPTLQSATNSENGVHIKWEKVDNAEGYVVLRKISNANWSIVATINSGDIAEHIDINTVSGSTYSYTVRAIKGSDMSGYDSIGKSIYYLSMPAVSAVNNGNHSALVTWSEVKGSRGYIVYRKTTGGSWQTITTITDSSNVSYVDCSLTEGAEYTYTVCAIKGNEQSAYNSEGVSVVIEDSLEAPILINAKNAEKGVLITWQKVSDAEGYAVFRKTNETDWTRIAVINNGSTMKYTDIEVISGTKYIYTVQAIKGDEISEYDTVGKSVCYLSMPVLSVANNGNNSVLINWDEVNGAEGYAVYRKTINDGFKRITTITEGNTVSYVDSELTSGVTYFYTVRAIYGDEMSSYNGAGVSIIVTDSVTDCG